MGGHTCPECGEPADRVHSILAYERLTDIGEVGIGMKPHRADEQVYLHRRGFWAHLRAWWALSPQR